MTVAPMSDLLIEARHRGYAIGYYESWDQYSMEAAIEAAEECNSPAIIGFGGAVTNQEWLDQGGVEELARLAIYLARRSAVPTAVLFNEARTMSQLEQGIHAGCNTVMLDTSHMPFMQNLLLTQEVVNMAHQRGAGTEAELGRLADATDILVQAMGTDPAEARQFVAETEVDALAVSIGNVHILSNGEATVDLVLLERIHSMVQVPLVVHGGTGFPPALVRKTIERGVAKFNVGTRLKQTYLLGVREAVVSFTGQENIHPLVGSREITDVFNIGKMRLKDEIKRFIRLYGSDGKARVA